LRLQQIVGIALFVAGLCVMANHVGGRIHEMRDTSTWSTSMVPPAAAATTLHRHA
jgi:hypothetical protein